MKSLRFASGDASGFARTLGSLAGFALVATAAAQETTTYTYDVLGRLRQVDYNQDNSQKYHYDPAGNRSEVTVTGYDSPANDAPTAVDDAGSVNEDGSTSISPLVNDVDPEGDPLSLASVGAAGHGSAVKNGNSVTYTPNANWNGVDTFTYTVSDGSGTDTGAVTVTVNSVNDAPNAVNDSISTAEDTPKAFNPRVNDTDLEGNTLTITGKTNGSKGSVTIVNSGTELRYSPSLNKNGSDSFTYTISDGNGGTDTASVSVTISAVNDAPNAVNDTFSGIARNTWHTFGVLGNDTDPENNPLTITSTSVGFPVGAIANVSSSGTSISYNCQCTSSDSVIFYTISDGHGGSDSASVSISLVSGSSGGGGGGGGFGEP